MEKDQDQVLVACDFRASWRSPVGVVVALFAILGAGLAVAAWRASSIGWLVGALGCGALVWLMSAQFRSRTSILRIDAHGVGSYWLKGRTIPWTEIVDIHGESVQGHPQLVLRLAEGAPSLGPTARLLSDRKPMRRIPLGALPGGRSAEATRTAVNAFLEHRHAQADSAGRAGSDELIAQAQFDERLRSATPFPWALYLTMALNVGVWLANSASGMSPTAPQPAELFRWGANSAWAVTQDGQFWRLVTAAFLHGGVAHLGLNMLGLWSAGTVLNRMYGNGQFLIIYLVSAVVGNALSLHFSAQRSVAVGASGAVFGVLGALLIALWQHREHLPPATRNRLLASQAVFISASLVPGFARAGIDNAAHVGGLVAGGVCAWLLVERLDAQVAAAVRRRRALLTLAASIAAVALLVRTVEVPPIDHARAFNVQTDLQVALRRLQEAESALQRDDAANRGGQMSDNAMREAMRQRHLPAYRQARDALAALSLPSSDPQSTVLANFQRLSAMPVEVLELEQRRSEAGANNAQLDAEIQIRVQQLRELSEHMRSTSERKAGR